jgi:uncharacterized protein YlxW (UPF0749 family)
MSDLSKLFTDIAACGQSSKNVIDEYVKAMMALREASLQAEAVFQEKQAKYNAEIARLSELREEMRQGMKAERSQLQRELKELQQEVEKERAEVGRVKKEFLKTLDEISPR